MHKDKNKLLADLDKFTNAANDPKKSESQRRVYRDTVENIKEALAKLEIPGNGTPPSEQLTPDQKANRAANQRRVAGLKEKMQGIAGGNPQIRRQQPTAQKSDALPAASSGESEKLIVANPAVVRTVEIIWPGEQELQVLTFTELSRLFNSVFNDLSGSWAARMRDYDRVPERSPKGWMKAVTLYRAAFLLSGEWLPANRVGVLDTAGIIRKTIFKMIAEQAKMIEDAND